MLCTFPHLTTKEFEQACTDLQHRYNLCGNEKGDWLSVEMVQHFDTTCLEIRKELRIGRCAIDGINNEPEQDHVEEDDEEALQVVAKSQAVIHYDVLLSPVYYVPVLYFSISDPQHRCPPTMATLYEYLIPVEFRAQTESGGVIGGVSVQVSSPLGRNMQSTLSQQGPPHLESPSVLHPPLSNCRGDGG
jgi:ubiquitin-like-conjugating enzyme ATG10